MRVELRFEEVELALLNRGPQDFNFSLLSNEIPGKFKPRKNSYNGHDVKKHIEESLKGLSPGIRKVNLLQNVFFNEYCGQNSQKEEQTEKQILFLVQKLRQKHRENNAKANTACGKKTGTVALTTTIFIRFSKSLFHLKG